MGGGGGKGGKAPSMPQMAPMPEQMDLPAPPELPPMPTAAPPPEAPKLPDPNAASAEAERRRLEQDEQKRRRMMVGRESTILTDPLETWKNQNAEKGNSNLLATDSTSKQSQPAANNIAVTRLKKVDKLGG